MGAGFDAYLWIILGIMIAAGLLGGIANHYLAAWRERGAMERVPDWRYPVLGVVAALTAPLFLRMLSSDLVDAARIRPTDFLVFAGFCIVYVIATRGIVDALALRVGEQWKLLRHDIENFEEMSRSSGDPAETDEAETPIQPGQAEAPGTKTDTGMAQERAWEKAWQAHSAARPAAPEEQGNGRATPEGDKSSRTEYVRTAPVPDAASAAEPRSLSIVETRIEPSQKPPETAFETTLLPEADISEPEEEPEKKLSLQAQSAIELLSYNDVEIMYVIAAEAAVYGNLSALTEKTGLNRDLLSARLTMLKNLGLIETRIDAENILHWFVTDRGREILNELFAGQSKNRGRLRA